MDPGTRQVLAGCPFCDWCDLVPEGESGEVLGEHVLTCPAHPMRQVEAERDQARRRVGELETAMRVLLGFSARADPDAGWLTIGGAARKYRIHYEKLRRFVKAGVFTRGVFTTSGARAAKQPPIYLRVVELDAFVAGGAAAVAPLKAAWSAQQTQEDIPCPKSFT